MLFNSYAFLFVFLPAALAAFALARRFAPEYCASVLGAVSLVLYGWWNPFSVSLVCMSIVFNFGVLRAINDPASAARPTRRRHLLIFGVAGNLFALAYFKYAGFLLQNFEALSGHRFSVEAVELPLGISFFTFTQIAFLVDSWRAGRATVGLGRYVLFVTFFPHLIAGPIYHHKEMLPQFSRLAAFRLNAMDFAVGSSLFMLGLFKKTVFADGIAPFADRVYLAAASGTPPGTIDAWVGTLAFALQIYFDFSGYSDMAIGVARLFGIALPLNFASPYKARSIIEFWRCWHMTLSRFLRDYLYIPLGGNRRGGLRTAINVLATMLLGGLWHGANWTFVAWGAMHGTMLAVNHAWRARAGVPKNLVTSAGVRAACVGLTFAGVVAAWVLFRSSSIGEAAGVYRGMLGMGPANAADIPDQLLLAGAPWCALLLAIAWFAPNTQQIMHKFNTALPTYPEAANPGDGTWWLRYCWKPDAIWACLMALIALSALVAMAGSSRFLYFQF